MLLAIRHGRTEFNEDGQERLRGWLPVPLSPEGIHESQQAARTLQRLRLPIVSLHSSPLHRARQTSDLLGPALRLPVQVTDSLADWNVGALAGQSVRDTLPLLHRYLDKPEIAPPHGEPYAAFDARCVPFLQRLIGDQALHAVVSHNRVMTLLNALSHHDRQLLYATGPIEPAGALIVKSDGTMSVLFGARQAHHAHPSQV